MEEEEEEKEEEKDILIFVSMITVMNIHHIDEFLLKFTISSW